MYNIIMPLQSDSTSDDEMPCLEPIPLVLPIPPVLPIQPIQSVLFGFDSHTRATYPCLFAVLDNNSRPIKQEFYRVLVARTNDYRGYVGIIVRPSDRVWFQIRKSGTNNVICLDDTCEQISEYRKTSHVIKYYRCLELLFDYMHPLDGQYVELYRADSMVPMGCVMRELGRLIDTYDLL